MITFADPGALKRITQAMATLDLILEPAWECRTTSHNAAWSGQEERASMRDGSGDAWFLRFHRDGWAALKAFAHESAAARDAACGLEQLDEIGYPIGGS